MFTVISRILYLRLFTQSDDHLSGFDITVKIYASELFQDLSIKAALASGRAWHHAVSQRRVYGSSVLESEPPYSFHLSLDRNRGSIVSVPLSLAWCCHQTGGCYPLPLFFGFPKRCSDFPLPTMSRTIIHCKQV